MPRLRTIKPGFFTNDRLAELCPLDRLLFAGLWCLSDRAGRLEDRPKRIKAEVLPYDEHDVDAALDRLAAGVDPFIVRYQVGGQRFIQVCKFAAHQNPHIREPASKVPAPYDRSAEHSAGLPDKSAEHSASTVQAPDEHRAKHQPSPAVLGLQSLDSSPGSGLQSLDLEGDGSASLVPARSPTPPADPPPELAGLSTGHPLRLLWDAFDSIFGAAMSRAERGRRAKACKEALEAHADPAMLIAAAAHWPNVMSDATMSELGIVANLGKLLHGPQINGRSAGTVRQHTQKVTEWAAKKVEPEWHPTRRTRAEIVADAVRKGAPAP